MQTPNREQTRKTFWDFCDSKALEAHAQWKERFGNPASYFQYYQSGWGSKTWVTYVHYTPSEVRSAGYVGSEHHQDYEPKHMGDGVFIWSPVGDTRIKRIAIFPEGHAYE